MVCLLQQFTGMIKEFMRAISMRTFCILAAIFVPGTTCFSQQYKTINISLSQGLSQSCVYDIVQDKQGFTWLATQDGLNRYNGIEFKIFRDDPFDTTTLSTNFINCLFVDSRGWLWIGTQQHGLNLFIPATESFRRFHASQYKALGHDNINDICEDQHGKLWIATSKGLAQLTVSGNDPSKATTTFFAIKFKSLQIEKPDEPVVSKIFIDRHNTLWAAIKEGLIKFGLSNSSVVNETFLNSKNNFLPSDEITSFTQDAFGRTYMGTAEGLCVYDYKTTSFSHIGPSANKNSYDGMRYINSVYCDASGNLWAGTAGNGLFVYRKEYLQGNKTDFTPYKIPLINDRQSSMILCLKEDAISAGLMWVGTFAGGFFKIVPKQKNFSSNYLEYPGVESPLVTCVMKDNSGIVWAGTQNGLVRIITSEKKTNIFTYDEKNTKLMANYISVVQQDKNGTIWVGTEWGIQRIENPTSPNPKFISYSIDADHAKKFIRSIYFDDEGVLYVIYRKDIFKYKKEQDKFELFCQNPDTTMSAQRGYSISSMLIDRNNNCWIGSTMGLAFFTADANGIIKWNNPMLFYHQLADTNTLRSHSIQCITEDGKGNIWLGTSNGLTKAIFTNGKMRFTNYSTQNNIKNTCVYAVVEEPETGFLWLSTNGGLTRFDPAGIATANFDINDDLQSNEFNAGAYSRAADGEMFFGGIQGYTSFYPSQIKLDNVAPKVFITDFDIPGKNKTIEFDASGNKKISLKYAENSFTIDFIGLHYHDPLKNQYAYKLEGFHKDWNYCGTSRQVNFSQLPPGEYVFKVIASNNDGVYSAQSDTITITIKPPFYKTIWFYLSLLGLIGIVLWLLHIYRLQMKLAQVKEVERIRKETAADFHDELGHKLTTISWFSEILKKKLKPEQTELKGYLEKIIETSGNLYLTMKDLLWAMDPEKDSVYHTFLQLKNFGQELFDHTGVEFNANEINEDLKEVDVPLSFKRHLLLIFKEVMHNSLKHGSATHTFLDLEKNNGTMILRFGDDGKGFNIEGLNGHGHGIKNVKRRAELIHAETNFKSNGTGTVFELKLNLN